MNDFDAGFTQSSGPAFNSQSNSQAMDFPSDIPVPQDDDDFSPEELESISKIRSEQEERKRQLYAKETEEMNGKDEKRRVGK